MANEGHMKKLAELHERIQAIRAEIREVQASRPPEAVSNYTFASNDGDVTLDELFGGHDTLFVIHNMGRGCTYCTLWADGFNGVIDHLENRASFVVSSPDDPETQASFADSRGWRFKMVSNKNTSFAEDMGFAGLEDGAVAPGVSVFKKDGDQILRVSDAPFGPGDDFCSVWHFFDLIPQGADGWQPRYEYDAA